MYAVIKTGGKQYKVQEGDIIFIEKLNVADGESIKFEEVIAVSKDKGITVGKPYVKGAVVEATVVKNGKSKKILVFKYKPKKGYRRRQGHRQPYTKVQINAITV